MNDARTSKWCWAQLVSCCLLCAFAFALPLPCFGVFISPMVADFGSSVTEVNLYFTFMTAAAVVSCALGTRILMRWMRQTVFICAAAMALAYLALAFFGSVPMVWVAGIVAGLCYPLCSSVLVPIVINAWFARKQATFIGVAFALVGASGVVFGPVLTAGIATFGWRMTLAAAGIVVFAVCAGVALLLLRPRPEEMGALPYGASGDRDAKAESNPAGDASAPGKATAQVPYFGLPFALVAAGAVFSGVLGDLNTQVNAIAQQSGFDAVTAGIAFSCISGGLLVGKIILGSVKDARGSVTAIALGCACGIVAFALLSLSIWSTAVIPLYIGSLLAGFCTCLGTVVPALLASEAFDQAQYSRAVGHATAFCNLGMAIGAPLYSLSFDKMGTYLPVTVSLCIVAALTTVVGLCAVRSYRRTLSRCGR